VVWAAFDTQAKRPSSLPTRKRRICGTGHSLDNLFPLESWQTLKILEQVQLHRLLLWNTYISLVGFDYKKQVVEPRSIIGRDYTNMQHV